MVQNQITELKKEQTELEQKLASQSVISDANHLKQVSQRYKEVSDKIAQLTELQSLEHIIASNQKIIDNNIDHDLTQIAQEEMIGLEQQRDEIQNTLQKATSPYGDINEAIIEIRPGVGGDESSLFAQDLLRMYTRYAEQNGFNAKIIEQNVSEIKGVKDATIEIQGKNIYHLLKNEKGVHRVQRIPETEKNGRIHTSTASVAVLPKAKIIDIKIKPEDIKMEAFRASGPGGQNVNKVSTAIRVTHIPSGMSVASQQGRSQAANRETALTLLRSRLLEEKIEKEEAKIREERQEQIGRGERSEKIRTYNFPQDRITDHRINKSWHNIEAILDGDLNDIIESLQNI